MFKFLLVVLLVAIAVGINYCIIQSMLWWGYFQRTFNHGPKNCKQLEGIVNGSGAVTVLSNGNAFITSGYVQEDPDEVQGEIFLFRLSQRIDRVQDPVKLQVNMLRDYKLVSPDAISSWDDRYLYVINHDDGDVVDRFEIGTGPQTVLNHDLRIANESDFTALNDLSVVDENKFYFTNWYRYHAMTEMALHIGLGSVGFYNGSSARLVKENLFIPSGVVALKEKNLLYVAVGGDHEIHVYKINSSNYDITFDHAIKLSTMVDTLILQGDFLYVTAIPVPYKLMEYSENPVNNTCPSQVLRVTLDGEKVEEMYSNTGEELSATSVVAGYRQSIYIGTVTSDNLYCTDV